MSDSVIKTTDERYRASTCPTVASQIDEISSLSGTTTRTSHVREDPIVDVKCKIRLNQKVQNNTLGGTVEIVSNFELIIQHAFIEIIGVAVCKFGLDKTYINFPRIYRKDFQVEGVEQFYFTRRTLCGGDITHKHLGSEIYDFSCFWPSRLPGTLIAEYGFVKFIGKVIIKLRGDIYTHSQDIMVKFKRNLATEQHLLHESRVDVKRNFFGARATGIVYVSLWLPIGGVAAGQAIPLLCTITNHSKFHFGGVLFVLTRIDLYRSNHPVQIVKAVRTDICRVARMVNIHHGKYEYYVVLRTDTDTLPTTQFYTCTSFQIIYEIWASIQGVFPRYYRHGYPNIDTPGIPIIIGTKPLQNYEIDDITDAIFKRMYDTTAPIMMDELPEDVKHIIDKTEDDISEDIRANLERQLEENRKVISQLKHEKE